MLRIDATNLPSPRRVARSRQLAPRPASPRRATVPPPRPQFGSEPPTIRVPRETLLSGVDDGPITNRLDVTPTRPFKGAAPRPTPIPAPALAQEAAAFPGPLPPPPRLPHEILRPELAAQPVTGNTISPTAMDAAPTPPPIKTRRPLELVGVATIAFALAWIGRGSLPAAPPPSSSDDVPRMALNANPPNATALPVCEDRPHAGAASATSPSDIRTVAVSDLPLLGSEPAVPTTSRGAAAHHQTPAHGSAKSPSSGGAPTRASLVAALSSVAGAAAGCGEREGPVKVLLTFGPSGVARSIQVSGKDLPGGTRACIARAASRARVPAFEGDPVTVGKTL